MGHIAAVELPRSNGTPLSVVTGAAFTPRVRTIFVYSAPQRERIVVGVGLQDDGGIGIRALVPYDEFALEILVFSQSE